MSLSLRQCLFICIEFLIWKHRHRAYLWVGKWIDPKGSKWISEQELLHKYWIVFYCMGVATCLGWKVMEVGDVMIGEPTTTAPMNVAITIMVLRWRVFFSVHSNPLKRYNNLGIVLERGARRWKLGEKMELDILIVLALNDGH